MLLSLLTAGPELSERPMYPTGTPQFAPEPPGPRLTNNRLAPYLLLP
jgi:hypothetical protein